MDNPLDFVREIEWLRHRQDELRVAIEYEKKKETEFTEKPSNLEEVTKSLSKTETELEEETKNDSIRRIALQSLQLADITYRTVASHLDGDSATDEDDGDTINESVEKELTGLLKEITKIGSQICRRNEKVRKLEDEVTELQLTVAGMVAERNYLMKRIEDKEEKRQQEKEKTELNEVIKKLETKTHAAAKIIQINNQIMPLLIGHSGLRWAKDPELLEMILDCGKPFEEQLENIEQSSE